MISIKKRKEVRRKTRLIDFAPSAPSLKLEATLTDDTLALIGLRVGPGGSNRILPVTLKIVQFLLAFQDSDADAVRSFAGEKKGIIFQMSTTLELE